MAFQVKFEKSEEMLKMLCITVPSFGFIFKFCWKYIYYIIYLHIFKKIYHTSKSLFWLLVRNMCLHIDHIDHDTLMMIFFILLQILLQMHIRRLIQGSNFQYFKISSSFQGFSDDMVDIVVLIFKICVVTVWVIWWNIWNFGQKYFSNLYYLLKVDALIIQEIVWITFMKDRFCNMNGQKF